MDCSKPTSILRRRQAKRLSKGPEIASSLCAATFDFGDARAFLTTCFREARRPEEGATFGSPELGRSGVRSRWQ
jgi:hypothetical protein